MQIGKKVGRAFLAATMMTSAVIGVGATADAATQGDRVPVRCSDTNRGISQMFPDLNGASWSDADLGRLGDFTMEIEHKEGSSLRGTTDEARNIDAGHTYTGQFIVHDITRDVRQNDLRTPANPLMLTNERTQQLDLDSIYAGGPDVSPFLYEADGLTFKLGEVLLGAESDPFARDHLRNTRGQAVTGDSRNDENRITASLTTLLQRSHNRTVEWLQRRGVPSDQIFEQAQNYTIWHYQWAVLTDFLPTVIGQNVMDSIVWQSNGVWQTDLDFYHPCMNIPVEFSVAAQRFGHSMVRNDYDINEEEHSIPIFANTFDPKESLVGFQPSPKNFAIDWDLFFDQEDTSSGANVGDDEDTAQQAYKPDVSLVPELRLLPLPETGLGPAELANRNLLRSQQMGIPSGQDVARAMGIQPLPDHKIIIGPAIDDEDTKAITELGASFAGKAPLWTYVNAEAVNMVYNVNNGQIDGDEGDWFLGPVGGRIVAETFVGLLLSDPNSILNNPGFRPDPAAVASDGDFGFRELVNEAAKYVGPMSHDCWRESEMISPRGDRERFSITNNTDETIRVYRIEDDGERHLEELVSAGDTDSDGSYVGVHLIFTDDDGNCFETAPFGFPDQQFTVNADWTLSGSTQPSSPVRVDPTTVTPLPANDCAREAQVATMGGFRKRYWIKNNTARRVLVYRINAAGNRFKIESMAPGEIDRGSARLGVTFVFTDKNGNCFDTAEFRYTQQRFVINSDFIVSE